MDKNLSNVGKRYLGYRILSMIVSPIIELPDFERDKPHEASLLDSIFAIDERTKLPQGDLAVFMSENTSPEVKQFIQQNLLQDNNVQLPENGKDLDDDTISALTRGSGESVSSYRDRVMDWLKQSMRESHDVEAK